MIIHLTKNQIRQDCLTQRRALSQDFVVTASDHIIHQITQLPIYHAAEHIAWYYPVQGEVDLSPLWATALQDNKSCYAPVIQADKTLMFLAFTGNTLWALNRFKIAEPKDLMATAVDISALDLVFLPMVAFDDRLVRLGMGAGYYDKTFASSPTRPTLIGVAYEWQKKDSIPTDPWDIKPDIIVTEKKTYNVSSHTQTEPRP